MAQGLWAVSDMVARQMLAAPWWCAAYAEPIFTAKEENL
jgi:hypothetical protein